MARANGGKDMILVCFMALTFVNIKVLTRKLITDWSPPPAGIFTNHLDYAKWYTTQWALRMMDVVEHYDPDFIYTDGTVQGPFTGNGTGTGIKADAMPTGHG